MTIQRLSVGQLTRSSQHGLISDHHLSCLHVILTGCSAQRGGITILIPEDDDDQNDHGHDDGDNGDDGDGGDDGDDGDDKDDSENKYYPNDDFPASLLHEHQQGN